MKYIVALLAGCLLLVEASFAKSYTYIYIEGDKQTPFYVKLEGQMMPRLGKNYCIIPNLDAGITNIEILFQQNKFPSQKFIVKVPAEGNRGFVLQKVNDRQFALYDIQQGIYLVSGNKAEDDQLPAAGSMGAAPVAATAAPASPQQTDTDIPAFATNKKPAKKKVTKPAVKEEKPQTEPEPKSRFISDIELNASGTTAEDNADGALPDYKKEKPAAKKKPVKTTTRKPVDNSELAAINDDGEVSSKTAKPAAAVDNGMPNTDCKSPMSSEDFENFALKILDKADDDARLKVLSKNKGRLCFTTEQVRIIANNLDTQSGRYEVTRLLYAQTSDQGNYPKLESLFKTVYLKNKFKEILNPKQ